MSDDLSRRKFIEVSSSVVAVAAAGGAMAGCARFQPPVALGPLERRLVDAIADQIVPPDQDPGGRDALVGEFIDVQLRGPYERYLPAYRAGLAHLEQTSRALHGTSFLDVSFERQTAVLEALERDTVPPGIWKPGEAPAFFRLVCDHCLQGYYGSPRHGGNRGATSWKMLGLDYPQVAGRVTT